MKSGQFFFSILTFSVVAAITSSAGQAAARACSSASDCPKGFDCQLFGVVGDGGPGGACESLPCQSNSDCGDGLSCNSNLGTTCQAAPDGGQACAPASACVPQWQVPCVVDTDCGPGYACMPNTGGFYDCGKDQDASEPSYYTSTVVPCSAVPEPPFLPPPDSGLTIPAICEAGTTCTKLTWNSCVAQPTGTCAKDADCPSTWTCGCQATCGVSPLGAQGPAFDAGCTMACIPPNSDLSNLICAGVAGGFGSSNGPSNSGEPDGGSAAPPPIAPAIDGGPEAAASKGASDGASSSESHGGCQIGSSAAGASWAFVGAAVVAVTRRRRRSSDAAAPFKA